MKCPIKLSHAVAEFIKKNDLVYVGEGNPDKPLFKGKNIKSLSTDERETSPEGMHNNCGNWKELYYFVSRPDAKKHFPHRLPKARETRKVSPKPANHIVPNGYVYLGMAGEFKNAGSKFFGYYLWDNETFGKGGGALTEPREWDAPRGGEFGYYYAPINSEVAHLNGLGPKKPKVRPVSTEVETLREENAALKARVAELESEKEKLRAAIKALNNF